MGTSYTKWGEEFDVEIVNDMDASKPWEQGCGLGIVLDRDAALTPGQTYIAMPNGYVFAWSETMAKARKEGWGRPQGKPYTSRKIRNKTQAAAQQQLDHFVAWLNDEWCYVGIVVTHSDGKTASLWGIEGNEYEYHRGIIQELISECCPLHEFERKMRETGLDAQAA